jgi:peptide/nickel transport system permease protein
MRFTEGFMIIPQFFLALLLVSIFGASIWIIIIVIGILSWPSTARLVRAEFLSLKERAFIESARALGAKDARIISREILPSVMSPVITNASLQMSRAILLEAALSFLGLGDPNIISWGAMLKDAQTYIGYGWWLSVFPGLAIFLTTMALNNIGDGLKDALNPRLKGGH